MNIEKIKEHYEHAKKETATLPDIVRKVAEEMMNTSMQQIYAETICGWATRLCDAVDKAKGEAKAR